MNHPGNSIGKAIMVRKAIIILLLTLVTSVAVKIAYGELKPSVSRPSFKKVIIANCVDSVPFHYNDEDGHPVGMLIDLWHLWSEKTGIQIEFKSSAWPGTLEMVRDGEADIHAGCFYSEERDKYLDYAAALRSCDTHFFFHDSIFGLKTLHDLIGFKIGVIEKDYAVDYLNQELPEATLAEYPSNEALFDAVERGEVRVFVYDTPATLYYLSKKGLRERSWQRDDLYCCVTDVGHL
jgi:ABC-type amino acid transport substrate-binding protein